MNEATEQNSTTEAAGFDEQLVMPSQVNAKAIERAVLADKKRPCLYGVAGPCFHPRCLESHFITLSTRAVAPSSG